MSIKNYMKFIVMFLLPFYRKALNRISCLEKRVQELEFIQANYGEEVSYFRNIAKNSYNALLNLKQQYEKPKIGSAEWLILTEYKYGGKIDKVKRNKVSDHDPRTQEQLLTGGMVGGDRMNELEHNYAPIYSHYLEPYITKHSKIILVEVGVLEGTGIALWSDLFQQARIIGLDIDLGHIKGNISKLKKLGAFRNNNIELYEFDQFKDNQKFIFSITKGEKIDIVIDDGVHLDDAILMTLQSFFPNLNDDFLYIIEDNKTIHQKISMFYPELEVKNYGELTIVTP